MNIDMFKKNRKRSRLKQTYTRVALIVMYAFASPAIAHKNHPHHKPTPKPIEAKKQYEESKKQEDQTNVELRKKLILNGINEDYIREVKPIFKRSCFDCHGQINQMPWYGSVPLVHWLIENDLHEAKEHLDCRSDFPFAGHGTIDEDLDAIADVINDGSMPPLRYRLMHPKSKLTEIECLTITNWVTKSREQLKGARFPLEK